MKKTASHQSILSVVIPTLNEADRIPGLLKILDREEVEVVVADGGSDDGTVEAARSSGAYVIDCPRGRAVQMNRGAGRAQGDILLFLTPTPVLPTGMPPSFVMPSTIRVPSAGPSGSGLTRVRLSCGS